MCGENDETKLHENEAAEVLRDLCQGPNMHATEPKEGKIELIADCDGLFLADIDRLRAVEQPGRNDDRHPAPAALCEKGR